MLAKRFLRGLDLSSMIGALLFATLIFNIAFYGYEVQKRPFFTSYPSATLNVRDLHGLQPEKHIALSARIKICVASAVTSAKMGNASVDEISSKFVFFRSLMPSFCQTATDGFDYFFYLGYDQLDGFFNQTEMRLAFRMYFEQAVNGKCSLDVRKHIHLKFIECPFNKKSAWAMNEAVMDGYLDGMDYFYRITDDITMQTKHWAPLFIEQLNQYDPPLVGVVGPNQTKGKTSILTHDFVHATHIDIFGFYFPRAFINWYADDWITRVYQPNRSTQLQSARIIHTKSLGTRYKRYDAKKELIIEESKGRKTLERYIRRKYSNDNKPDGTKVVAMSLSCRHPNYTLAAIRNAQLVPVIMPGWQLQVFVADPGKCRPEQLIPSRVIRKLRTLEADVIYVNTSVHIMPPEEWILIAPAEYSKDNKYKIRTVPAELLPLLSELDTASFKTSMSQNCQE